MKVLSKGNLLFKYKNNLQASQQYLHLTSYIANNHLKEASKFLKKFKKLDKRGQVIQVPNSEISKAFLAGSTSGGQKANRSKSLVRLTHNPTKIEAHGRITRKVHENMEYAMAKLRMQVDIRLNGDDSIFLVLKREEEEKLKVERNKKIEQRVLLKEKEAKLKLILSEKDTLIY